MFKLVVLLSVACLAVGEPSVGVVPVGYSGVVPASSLSQYSSSVVHGAPLASVYGAPLASVYGSPLASVYGSPLASVYSSPVLAAAYPALAQPPHTPAVVLDAVRGVPLDTPEVVAARAAHYQAKALSVHHLKKRSVAVAPLTYGPVVAPYSAYSTPLVSAYSSSVVSPYSPLVSPYSASVVASPLAYHGVVPKALSVHPW